MDEWIEHDGGSCPPLPSWRSAVQIKRRGGMVEHGCACDFSWMLWGDARPSDIVAYRLIEGFMKEPSVNPKDAIGSAKAPLSAVPMNVIAELGVGMFEGKSKYGSYNYRASNIRASVYFDATLRHLISWWEGEDTDPDSGLSHIIKAMASLTVLRDSQIRGMCEDDRPPSSTDFYKALNEKAASIAKKHADKSPRHYTIKDTPKGGNHETTKTDTPSSAIYP